jgi:hypothetical protein
VPQYGAVWVPRAVPVGWAPYRSGRWAWIAPWGWTWIDEAPWGFAPFHYGRWAFVGGIWCWVPGRFVARPVYAPALVGWIGRPGWSVTVSIGTVPAVGWFPLAPREVYVPAHRHSHAYVRNVNVTHVTNVTQITNVNNVTNVNYANRRVERAVTVVPAAAVTRGEPVGRSQVHVRRAELDRHAPASPTPPVAAIAPARSAMPQARREEGPERRLEPGPRAPATSAVQAAPGAVPRSVDVRSAPRQPIPRAEPPRASPLPAPATVPSQAAPRRELRTLGNRPEPRHESRHEVQRMEGPRTAAPPAPQPQHAQPRFEPRPEARRAEPSRAAAPCGGRPRSQGMTVCQ